MKLRFFALLDPKNRKPVRHVDTHKHYYEFRVYVDEVVFEQRLIRTDKNWISFRFSKQEQGNVLEEERNRHIGSFGKRLRDKAMMLRAGDHIIIRGYFNLSSIFGVIFITDIERL